MESKKFNLTFVVTHECNLRCSYCYESMRDKDIMSADFVKEKIAQYLNDESLTEVEIDFFGGEPWLKFDLIKEVCEWTWRQSWKNKYLFFTTTNGTLIHGEIQDWLRKNKTRIWCGLSLDGRKETHDKNRSNSFDKIDLDFFLECWPTQPVKMTISKETIDTLFEDIKYIQELGFKISGTNFAEGFDWSDEKYVAILCRELEKLTDFYIKHPEFEVSSIIDMAIQNCESPSKTKKWCGTGTHMVVYDINKEAYPCQFFTPMTISSEKFDTIKNIDFHDDEVFVDDYCQKECYLYNICPSCYGANFLVNGKLYERDKSKCKLIKMRAYYTAALKAQQILKSTSSLNDKNTAELNKIALQIRAIEKIKTIYEKEFVDIPIATIVNTPSSSIEPNVESDLSKQTLCDICQGTIRAFSNGTCRDASCAGNCYGACEAGCGGGCMDSCGGGCEDNSRESEK